MTPRPEFDPSTLARTERMVGRRAVNEIVSLFLEHAPAEVEALQRAARSGSCDAAARAAHSLRSSAFNVGALRLYDLAGELERHATARDAAALERDVEPLDGSFALVRSELERHARSLTAKRIAVIEDNPDNRVLTRALLESRFEIVEFENGPDAIAALGEAAPDLILLDISLPGLDGVEVLRRLRAIDVLGEVPVIALTAHAMSDDRSRLLEAGFDEYVAKPILDEADLIGPIDRLLGAK